MSEFWCPIRGTLTTRRVAFASVSMVALGLGSYAAQAQTAAAPTSSVTGIKEITVTAERRSQSVKKVPASVVALKGSDLLAQGRNTVAQMLEDVPDVLFAAPNANTPNSGDNPNGNITIRGVQSTQQTGGTSGPSATATYVDDVFEGIGGDFDLDRVEVLRGPQGTLYGRSATGGVVSFHTADPVLGKFGGFIQGEAGSYDLRQLIAAVNIPIGDQLAVRVAAREFDQQDFYSRLSNSNEDQEARVKVLYRPLDNLRFIAGWTIDEMHNVGGGAQQVLSAPNKIDFDAETVPGGTAENHQHQYFVNTNYDFGLGNLTYIASFRNFFDNSTQPPVEYFPGFVGQNYVKTPLDQFHTEEVRIASDSGSKLTWLLGGNFYANALKSTTGGTAVDQPGVDGAPDPNPASRDVPQYADVNNGLTTDFGVFTEETYPVLSNLRLTGGARFDYTRVHKFSDDSNNVNVDGFGNVLNPPINASLGATTVNDYSNFTYKLRAEYDLTPTNMLYALTATGFLPGNPQLTEVYPAPGTITFEVLNFNQERLTSYEVGSKNRFFGDTLQVNADGFYYHYAGYQEAVRVGTGPGGAPIFVIVPVGVRMEGGELDAIWQATPYDQFTLTGAIIDAENVSYPTLAVYGNAEQYEALKRVPGIPPVTLNLAYNHTFALPDGSTLVPRAEWLFTGAENVTSLTAREIEGGQEPYDHQSATSVFNLYLNWTSDNGKYTVGGYVRNVGNEIYKTAIMPSTNGPATGPLPPNGIVVTPSSPRIYGVQLLAKF